MEAFAMILSYNNLAVINDAVNVSVIKNFGIKGSWWLHCSALEPEARRFSTHLPYKCTYLTRIQWASSVHLWHKKRPTTRVYLWQIKNTENFNLELQTRTLNLTNVVTFVNTNTSNSINYWATSTLFTSKGQIFNIE